MRRTTVIATGLIASLCALAATAQVKVTYEDEARARQRQIEEIGANLAKQLPALLETFEAQRRKVREAGDPPEGLSALLGSTEAALLELLSDPEIAPLHDYVVEAFRVAREQLRLSPQTSDFSPPVSALHIRRAAFQERATRSEIDQVLDGIATFIKTLFSRSKSQELLVTLCVKSRPEGATFTMSALIQPDKPYTIQTNHEVLGAVRGLYRYRIQKDGQATGCPPPSGEHGPCRPINLWDDPPGLSCDLGAGVCQPEEPRPGQCTGGGR
jgi:hypothetical protein